jgi:hypothetical protein
MERTNFTLIELLVMSQYRIAASGMDAELSTTCRYEVQAALDEANNDRNQSSMTPERGSRHGRTGGHPAAAVG